MVGHPTSTPSALRPRLPLLPFVLCAINAFDLCFPHLSQAPSYLRAFARAVSLLEFYSVSGWVL